MTQMVVAEGWFAGYKKAIFVWGKTDEVAIDNEDAIVSSLDNGIRKKSWQTDGWGGWIQDRFYSQRCPIGWPTHLRLRHGALVWLAKLTSIPPVGNTLFFVPKAWFVQFMQ